jgi:uncharacterized protein (DUF1778 family)
MMAEAVVEDRESIHVREQDGMELVGVLSAPKRVVDVVQEQPPVRQARQRIAERIAGEL